MSEEGEFKGTSWASWVDPAVLLWKPGEPDYERPHYMTRTEKDEPQYTPDEEYEMMRDQVNDSDGFDIDFKLFRCVFNYHPADFSTTYFTRGTRSTADLLKDLSIKSLEKYNLDQTNEYEFVEVVKANFHFSAGFMFLITFKVKDPFDGLIKFFQARVRYAENIVLQYVFCRPQPNQKVECVVIVEKDMVEKDAKKQRLEE